MERRCSSCNNELMDGLVICHECGTYSPSPSDIVGAKIDDPDEIVLGDLSETVKETYEMYKQGKSLADIAQLRALSSNTIYNHMTELIGSGLVQVEDVVSEDRIRAIEEIASKYDHISVNTIKKKLSEDISYSQIQLVLASLGKLKTVFRYKGKSTSQESQEHIQPDESNIGLSILQCLDDLSYPAGRKLLTNLLIGSKSKYIIEGEFTKSRYYSSLDKFSTKQIGEFITQLLDNGYLETSTSNTYYRRPVFILSEQGLNAVKSSEAIPLELPEIKQKKPKKIDLPSKFTLSEDENDLFLRLKKWRSAYSVVNYEPLFFIFHNKVLRNIAKIKPKSIEELLQVPGVGKDKSEKYGEEVLKIINSLASSKVVEVESEFSDNPALNTSELLYDLKNISTLVENSRLGDAEVLLGEVLKKVKIIIQRKENE